MLKPLTGFVLDTLTNTFIQSVHFRYGAFRVTPDGYRRDIAGLIHEGRIRVTIDPADVGLSESSSADAAFVIDTPAGRTHPLFIHPRYCEVHGGTVYVKDTLSSVESARLRGTVVHEATHALQDLQRVRLNRFQAEGSGYIAGAITARRWGMALPPRGHVADPYENRLMDGHGVALWIVDPVLEHLGPHYAVPQDAMTILEQRVRVVAPERYAFNGI